VDFGRNYSHLYCIPKDGIIMHSSVFALFILAVAFIAVFSIPSIGDTDQDKEKRSNGSMGAVIIGIVIVMIIFGFGN
jgi:hypothetical protein